jgi:outer membrane protein
MPPLPPASVHPSLDALVSQAYSNRQDLRQQAAIVQVDLDAVRQARIAAGLSVSASYLAQYQATNDIGPRGLDSTLLVTASFPLFDAGASRGAVRQAQGQLDQAKDLYDQDRLQVRTNVEQAYNHDSQYLQTAVLAQDAVKAAQVNFDSAIAANKAGVNTIVDVTTAESTLVTAQSQYVTAVYNYYIADAQLRYAIGQNE